MECYGHIRHSHITSRLLEKEDTPMFKKNVIVEAIEKFGIKKAITVGVVTLCVLFPTVLAIFNIIYTS